ncbi:MAG: TIGR02206 family membrane protein [Saprospiraceae bacterium]|nr:TIGR02206 family membrane protein [Saprospiraceae bacterium]HMW38821.1 TIGR02206 family membrane protein [Saprospiraceae bacterium]HMX89647.1 TIGR02206 family membrane protein [Saprospiraceae bacterium]HMZ40830.1 TIGR02206 family membrane protein [Saprospiraceae bacterium]HNA63578.1 TIGR02206 family membrane protein [Saprospiraceae bacterium]
MFELNSQLIEKFQAFGAFHVMPILVMGISCYFFIRKARNWTYSYQLLWAKIFTTCIVLTIVGWMGIKIVNHQFDPSIDLPFHLCNILPFVTLFILLTDNQRYFGILYFFILAGTLQAIITPDLKEAYPHYIYFRYWIIHCGLVMLVFYFIHVLQWRVHYKDIRIAMLYANGYLVFSILINIWSGGNYFFSMAKPEASSLLDYLGPWPLYLLTGQLAMYVLFVLLYQPVKHIGLQKDIAGTN